MGLAVAGISAAAGSEPPVHDLPGHVQDCGVAVQDEVSVGGQDDPVQLEGELVRVFARGEKERADDRPEIPAQSLEKVQSAPGNGWLARAAAGSGSLPSPLVPDPIRPDRVRMTLNGVMACWSDPHIPNSASRLLPRLRLR